MMRCKRINAKALKRKGAKEFVPEPTDQSCRMPLSTVQLLGSVFRVVASLRLSVKSRLRGHGLAPVLILFASLSLFAQTNSETTNALPKLLPPYAEMPPTFWERYGVMVTVAMFGVVGLVVFCIWLRLRPKPQVILPPEVQARLALEALRQRPEDGACLSNVSQIVRHYFIAAFQLPPGELTATQFCQVISNHAQISSELSKSVADFLQECDERKFSLENPSAPLGAMNRALKLITLGEARRVQLRQLAETKIQEKR